MKVFISISALILSLNSFSAVNLLSKSESTSILQYLDDICMDTFCGGDFDYYMKDLSCDDSSCTVKMKAREFDGDYYLPSITIGSVLSRGNYTVHVNDLENEEKGKFVHFDCKISNVGELGETLHEKTQSMYDHVSFGCVNTFVENL